MNKIKNKICGLIGTALCLVPLNAYAGTLNPSTGDTTGRFVWIIAIVAGVALVAAIISGIMSKKKK